MLSAFLELSVGGARGNQYVEFLLVLNWIPLPQLFLYFIFSSLEFQCLKFSKNKFSAGGVSSSARVCRGSEALPSLTDFHLSLWFGAMLSALCLLQCLVPTICLSVVL